jgi:streptogramin lyase
MNDGRFSDALRSTRPVARWMAAAALLSLPASCSGGDTSSGTVGEAVVALQLAPAEARCLQVQVAGSGATVTRQMALTPAANTTYLLEVLPLGMDTFSAAAFVVSCDQTSGQAPEWTSDVVSATVVVQTPVQVILHMQPAGESDGGPGTEPDGGLAVIGVDFPTGSCAPATTTFPIPTPNSNVSAITAGPDGNVWFVEFSNLANKVGKITPDGVIQEFTIPTPNAGPQSITLGVDGNLWFIESTAGTIGQVTPSGTFREFKVPSTLASLEGLTAGPDGNLWFPEGNVDKMGVITPDGSIREFPLPPDQACEGTIAAGSDGNLWCTAEGMPDGVGSNKLVAIGTDGSAADFLDLPTGDLPPQNLVSGPDGSLWFTTSKVGKFGFKSPLQEFALPTIDLFGHSPLAAFPAGLAVGPDGTIWIPEGLSVGSPPYPPGVIGQITTDGLMREHFIQQHPRVMTAGPDGNLWFADDSNNIVRMTPYVVCSTDAGVP